MRENAEIGGVRIHDLRHAFAPLLVSGWATLEMIGQLLGHTQIGTTQRYAYLIDSPLRAGVNAVGGNAEAKAEGGEKSRRRDPAISQRIPQTEPGLAKIGDVILDMPAAISGLPALQSIAGRSLGRFSICLNRGGFPFADIRDSLSPSGFGGDYG